MKLMWYIQIRILYGVSKFHVKQTYTIEIIFRNIATTHVLMCKQENDHAQNCYASKYIGNLRRFGKNNP